MRNKVNIRFISYWEGVGFRHAGVKYNLQYRFLWFFWIKMSISYHGIRIPINKGSKSELIKELLSQKNLNPDSTQVIEHPEIIYH